VAPKYDKINKNPIEKLQQFTLLLLTIGLRNPASLTSINYH